MAPSSTTWIADRKSKSDFSSQSEAMAPGPVADTTGRSAGSQQNSSNASKTEEVVYAPRTYEPRHGSGSWADEVEEAEQLEAAGNAALDEAPVDILDSSRRTASPVLYSLDSENVLENEEQDSSSAGEETPVAGMHSVLGVAEDIEEIEKGDIMPVHEEQLDNFPDNAGPSDLFGMDDAPSESDVLAHAEKARTISEEVVTPSILESATVPEDLSETEAATPSIALSNLDITKEVATLPDFHSEIEVAEEIATLPVAPSDIGSADDIVPASPGHSEAPSTEPYPSYEEEYPSISVTASPTGMVTAPILETREWSSLLRATSAPSALSGTSTILAPPNVFSHCKDITVLDAEAASQNASVVSLSDDSAPGPVESDLNSQVEGTTPTTPDDRASPASVNVTAQQITFADVVRLDTTGQTTEPVPSLAHLFADSLTASLESLVPVGGAAVEACSVPEADRFVVGVDMVEDIEDSLKETAEETAPTPSKKTPYVEAWIEQTEAQISHSAPTESSGEKEQIVVEQELPAATVEESSVNTVQAQASEQMHAESSKNTPAGLTKEKEYFTKVQELPVTLKKVSPPRQLQTRSATPRKQVPAKKVDSPNRFQLLEVEQSKDTKKRKSKKKAKKAIQPDPFMSSEQPTVNSAVASEKAESDGEVALVKDEKLEKELDDVSSTNEDASTMATTEPVPARSAASGATLFGCLLVLLVLFLALINFEKLSALIAAKIVGPKSALREL